MSTFRHKKKEIYAKEKDKRYGWAPWTKTPNFYNRSTIFNFPSKQCEISNFLFRKWAILRGIEITLPLLCQYGNGKFIAHGLFCGFFNIDWALNCMHVDESIHFTLPHTENTLISMIIK